VPGVPRVPQVPRVPAVPLLAMLAITLWTAAAAAAVLRQAAPTAATKTVNDGVYTTEQASRGSKTFEASCGICHDTGRFTGDEFFTAWTGKPLQELFKVISSTMPEDNPGGLKLQQYEDVTAYLLSVNKFAPGASDLRGGEAMRDITIVKPAAKRLR
jgi:S-disulfanyl-L-cysteine oxidoreductase SoxD